MAPEAPNAANSEETIESDMLLSSLSDLLSSSSSSLSAQGHGRNNGSSMAVAAETEEEEECVSRNGAAGLGGGGTTNGLLGDTGGSFAGGSLAFSLGLGVGLLATKTVSGRRDTYGSGAAGRGAGDRDRMVENPVGLRGDEPIASHGNGNVGEPLPHVSLNSVLFSDTVTLDSLSVKYLQELGLQSHKVFSL
jgi:hypothetical protein